MAVAKAKAGAERIGRPSTLADPLPGTEMVTVEIERLAPWTTYPVTGQSIWRYIKHALQARHIAHELTLCTSADAAQKFVAAWKWVQTTRTLSATITSPPMKGHE